jgi:hypothetical protein
MLHVFAPVAAFGPQDENPCGGWLRLASVKHYGSTIATATMH